VQAYGSDRLRVADDGRIFLSSRVPKEWNPRSVRAASSIPHPGTAVLWDDVFYEVISVEVLPNGGVQYEMAPFPEDLMMRGTVAYGEASEIARSADRTHTIQRERTRKIVNALAPITGHAPTAVQDWMHFELGTPPVALTVVSALPLIVFAAICLRWLLNQKMDQTPLPVPGLVALIGVYLGLESALRLYNSARSGRPMGSVPGLILYSIAHPLFLRHTRLPSAFTPAPGLSTVGAVAPADVALRDALTLREPILTLLSVSDQQKLKGRYGYSPARYGRKTAGVILAASLIGSITSIFGVLQGHGLTALLSLALSGWLTIEQLVRWPALASTGASSILRFVVRPLTGKLLD
jgi:hypothetical protein